MKRKWWQLRRNTDKGTIRSWIEEAQEYRRPNFLADVADASEKSLICQKRERYSVGALLFPSMLQAIVYLRVSTPKQADEGESLVVQESICRRYAEVNGYHILKVFREPYSGRKEERPVLTEMFAYVEKKKDVQAVIIRDIDRFTRGGSYFYELFKNRLIRNGVELIDTAGIIQPTRNTLEDSGFEYEWSRVSPSRISESMAAEQAREEVTKILTRMIGQQIRLVNEGYRTRPAPLGYRNKRIEDADGKKKTTLEPDPTEAPWIRSIFQLRSSGVLTDAEICERVNATGFRTRIRKRRDHISRKVLCVTGGLPLTSNMLQKYIKNPAYCGVILEKWTKYVPVPGSFEGLVDIKTFNQANRDKIVIVEHEDDTLSVEYNVKKRPYKLENPTYPYRHVVHCPRCQQPFRGSASRGKLGKRYPAYHCSRGHSYLRIPLKKFHDAIEQYICQLRFTPEFLDLFEAIALDVWRKRQRDALELTRKSGETVVELQERQVKLLGELTQTESPVVRKLLEQQIEELEMKIATASDVRHKHEVTGSKIKEYIARVKYLVSNPSGLLLNTANHHRLQQLWNVVFEDVPTYDEIAGGTPELAVIFTLAASHSKPKSQLVAQLSAKWNTFVKQVEAGCALPIEMFQAASPLTCSS